MLNIPSFSGFIDKLPNFDCKYSYFFDKKLLHLNKVVEREKKHIYLLGDERINYLSTKMSYGGNAIFYDCIQHFEDFLSNNIIIKPSYLYTSRYANFSFNGFCGLVFKAKFINQLFPPSQIVEYDSLNSKHNKDMFKEVRDGSKKILLKTFSAVDKKFDLSLNGIKTQICFNITSPGTIRKEDENLGEISSNFTIKFDEEIPFIKLKDYYLIVRKFFQFLTNRQDIEFEEVKILGINQGVKYDFIGNFYDFVHKSNELIKIVCPVELYFGHIAKLFKYISNEKINFNHIPKNNVESIYVSPEQYVNCCGSFEYNFAKANIDDNKDKKLYNEIIENFNREFIINKKYNSKQRSFCKKIDSIIKRELDSIEHKYCICLERYKEVLQPLLHDLERIYNIAKTPNLLGKHFSSYRNLQAHGELAPFTNEAICAYIVAGAIINCLILEKCSFSLEEIKKIINYK